MTEPTTLFLSRHGRTEWSVLGRYAGSSEIELDDVGREQAQRLARWAAGARLDAIRCSPMVRAVATAAGAATAAPTGDRPAPPRCRCIGHVRAPAGV